MSRRTILSSSLLVALAAALPSSSAHAQCVERSRLYGSTEASGDRFGSTIASDGTVMVVGAPRQDCAASDSGGAYVYRFDGTVWNEEAHLCASDGADSDYFGEAVAVDGDRIVIGARYDDDLGSRCGAAYVFRYQNGAWGEEVKLLASDGGADDEFGTSVAIQGTEVFVGAPNHDDTFSNRGAVYVFLYTGSITGWQEDQVLQHSVPASSDFYGTALDVDGDLLAVGVPYYHADNSGQVVVLERGGPGWQESAFFTSPNSGNSELYGSVLDLQGERLVVGMPNDSTGGSSAGAISVAHRVNGVWQEEAFLLSPEAAANARFGASASLDGDYLVGGSPYADRQTSDGGMLYSFILRAGGWYFDQPLGAKAPGIADLLGTSTVVVGNRAFSGAAYDDDKGSSSGTVYEHLVGDYLLESNASTYTTGDSLDISMTCGTQNTPAWFAIFAVNGSTFFQILLRIKFDASHEAGFTTTVPPGLSGTDLTFVSFKFAAWGKATSSNLLTLSFQ